VAGDTLVTGASSRAEVRLDNSNFVRLGPNSEIKLRQLGERAYQIDVVRGAISYTMMKYGEADVDLRTPNANVVPRKDGVYRVQVTGPKDSQVMVRKGEAEAMTPDGSVVVKKGKALAMRESDPAKGKVTSAAKQDAFDDWNERRDDILQSARGPIYGGGPWYPSAVHVGVGWGGGWGYWGPYWGGLWGPYWGGYYPRAGVVYPYARYRGYRRW